MKNQKSTMVCFLLAGALPTLAVERPSELDEEEHQLKKAPVEKQEQIGSEISPQASEEKPIIEAIPVAGEKPFLGVGSEPLDETLSLHLGVDQGLIVRRVHPGSGADLAGLQPHDILLSVDGQKVASPVALKDAVAQCHVGQEVPVEIIRRGEGENLTVKLTARPDGIPGIDAIPVPGEVGELKMWPQGALPQDPRQRMEELKKALDEQIEARGLGLKLHDLIEEMPEGIGKMDLGLESESSVTWADAEGDITMTMRNGKSVVRVRDREGKIVHEGPWDTEQDKAAVAPEIRKRIEGLDVKREGNQLHFLMEGFPGGR
ncbi:MAG: S1C family serine protease [Verrucomicrobiota bacterium JB023]|nr:S1C family serine protease [Verrucomicrobiota bacterium JB023]